MTDDTPEPLCVDYRGVSVYPEDVSAVPIEELEALVDEFDRKGCLYAEDRLREVIDRYE